MPEFSDHIVYVDESGDHGLDGIDPAYPVFVLTFCIFKKRDYVETVSPAIQAFKFRWFGHNTVVLHEREIRKQRPPFKFLQNRDLRDHFMTELGVIVEHAPMTIIASVINKSRLRERYLRPANPYEIALKFCMERTAMFLLRAGDAKTTTHCVFETRGVQEDRDLELEFRRICDGANYTGSRIRCLDIVFADKRVNSSGLQLADLTARPIGIRVVRPDQPNRAFDVIETRLDRNRAGAIRGWGLKVFP